MHRRIAVPFVSITTLLVLALLISVDSGIAILDGYDLLIIGPQSCSSAIQRFVDFKESQGTIARYFSVQSVEQTREEPDLVSKIHGFVSAQIRDSGIKYLILIGTYDELPTRYVYSPSDEMGLADFNCKPTDWYYAVPNWSDSDIGLLGANMPMIAVGRIPVKSERELDGIVSKIISIESRASAIELVMFGDQRMLPETLSYEPMVQRGLEIPQTSGGLRQLLGRTTGYVTSYTHGTPQALWTRDSNGDWIPTLTTEDAGGLDEAYGIHFLVACFAGAIDMGNESLARALLLSSGGPALVIASARSDQCDSPIPALFWERFSRSGDVGGSLVQSIRDYLLDPSFFTPQNPMFQRYNLYLTKVAYGDVSWRLPDRVRASILASWESSRELCNVGEFAETKESTRLMSERDSQSKSSCHLVSIDPSRALGLVFLVVSSGLAARRSHETAEQRPSGAR